MSLAALRRFECRRSGPRGLHSVRRGWIKKVLFWASRTLACGEGSASARLAVEDTLGTFGVAR